MLEISRRSSWLVDIALAKLIPYRANLGRYFLAINSSRSTAVAAGDKTRSGLDGVVEELSASGQLFQLPLGLLTRSVFRRSIADWEGAGRDLNEIEEIAEPGPMRLLLCDTALERARLAFAKIEAFAPLNDTLVSSAPPKPAVPPPEAIVELRAEAEKQIKTAADYIKKYGYHRRDKELDELRALLRGDSTFSDLPPHV